MNQVGSVGGIMQMFVVSLFLVVRLVILNDYLLFNFFV